MKVHFGLVAAFASLAAVSNASAQQKVFETQAGKPTTLWYICYTGSTGAPSISGTASNGTITAIQVKRANCGANAASVAVYTPNPGFRGMDRAYIYLNSSHDRRDVDIIVK